MNELARYVPAELGAVIQLQDGLLPIVERISKVIPPSFVWELFVGTPTETGGKITFPYFRVDSAVITSRDTISLLEYYSDKYTTEENKKLYDLACKQAFRALVWVEIGFQGLKNLASSPASKNWASAVRHTITDAQRQRGIMTERKKLMQECLSQFVHFRDTHAMGDDLFSQYRVEYLLKPYR